MLVGSYEQVAPAPATWTLSANFALPPGSGPKGIVAEPEQADSPGGFLYVNEGSSTLALDILSKQNKDLARAALPVGSQPLSVDVAAISVAASVANSNSKEGPPSQIRASQAQQKILRAFTANFGSNDVSVVDIQFDGQTPKMQVVQTIRVGSQPTSLDFDPNASKLYVNIFGNNSVSVIDVKPTGSQVIGTIGGFHEPIFVKVSPDGKRGYVSSQKIGEGVAVFDTATYTIIGRVSLPGLELRRLALSSDGKRLYVAARTDPDLGTGQIVVIDTQSLQVVQRFPTEPFPLEIAVTPNGRCLVITHSDPNSVSLMDATNGQYQVAKDPTARQPQSVAIVGNLAYVTNHDSDTISVFQFGDPCV
jgi:DNA-binding beta-propeller fold protein YncE